MSYPNLGTSGFASGKQFATPNQSAVNVAEGVSTPPVNVCADYALEAASQAHMMADTLLSELRQRDQKPDGPIPCRSGIDGKLMDARDHSDATLRMLQEIRYYLLG